MTQNESHEEVISLVDLIKVLIKHKKIIIGVTLLTILMTLGYIVYRHTHPKVELASHITPAYAIKIQKQDAYPQKVWFFSRKQTKDTVSFLINTVNEQNNTNILFTLEPNNGFILSTRARPEQQEKYQHLYNKIFKEFRQLQTPLVSSYKTQINNRLHDNSKRLNSLKNYQAILQQTFNENKQQKNSLAPNTNLNNLDKQSLLDDKSADNQSNKQQASLVRVFLHSNLLNAYAVLSKATNNLLQRKHAITQGILNYQSDQQALHFSLNHLYAPHLGTLKTLKAQHKISNGMILLIGLILGLVLGSFLAFLCQGIKYVRGEL
jgi:hypothetical protein